MVMSGGIPYIYSGEEFMMSYKDLEKLDILEGLRVVLSSITLLHLMILI